MESVFDAAEYNGQTFEKLVLDRELLRDKDFQNCRFLKCDLRNCDLAGSEFSDCIFEHCVLSLSKFAQCRLKGVRFSGSKLLGLDLSKCAARFLELGFKDCLIDACNFSALPLSKTRFEDCAIRGCVFGETDLTKAVFADCDLEGSVFHGAKLRDADFTSARNYFLDPKTNDVAGARFSLPEAVSLLAAFNIKIE